MRQQAPRKIESQSRVLQPLRARFWPSDVNLYLDFSILAHAQQISCEVSSCSQILEFC